MLKSQLCFAPYMYYKKVYSLVHTYLHKNVQLAKYLAEMQVIHTYVATYIHAYIKMLSLIAGRRLVIPHSIDAL